MFLIEIAHPEGALTADDRVSLAEEILSGLVGDAQKKDAEASEETMRRARTMTHIAFRGLGGWYSGDGPVPAEAAPPIWATVTVPEAWREDMARHTLGWIRRSVRMLDQRRGWTRTGGDLWINMAGVADGSIGLNGKPATADTVLEYMTEEFRAALADGREVPEGMLLDPTCGMQVREGPGALTLEHGGETYGFCAEACRSAFARRNGIPVEAA